MKIIDQYRKEVSIKREFSIHLLLIGLVVGSCAVFMGMLALVGQL